MRCTREASGVGAWTARGGKKIGKRKKKEKNGEKILKS